MGYLSERVSYLRGLADGLDISDDTKEGKLLKVIIDVLDDVAISVEEVEDEQKALLDDIDDISPESAKKMVKAFLGTEFLGGKYQKRIDDIDNMG